MKLALVTGSTDGIGKLTTLRLAEIGYHTIVHGRDPDKVKAVSEEIKAAGGNAEEIIADLSSLDEVRKMAEEIQARHERLDLLINNAGIGSGPKDNRRRKISKDGYELIFAVNYLAPFLLTNLLMPVITASGSGRIINVSSGAQSELDFDDLLMENRYDPSRAYSQSKLALILFTIELAERHKSVTVNSLHPGSLLDTKLVREAYGKSWGKPETGAEAILHLAESPELKKTTGAYFDQKKASRAHPQAYDKTARKRLWDISEKLVGGIR